VILPETHVRNALLVAERMRQRIFDTSLKTADSTKARVTLSIGVANSDDFQDRISLISAADKALYVAKETGRNRVCRLDPGLKSVIEGEDIPVELLETELLKKLARSIEKRAPFMKDQSTRVAVLAQDLAKEMGLKEDETEGLRQAALLHNIGSAKIPGAVLNKRGPLTDEELRMIRAHPEVAEMMLRKSPHLKTVLPAVLYHHERFDGKGYPSGLKGKEIPRSAQILAVTSSYSAMITDRPYRNALSKDRAREVLEKGSGNEFDPKVVKAFLDLIDETAK